MTESEKYSANFRGAKVGIIMPKISKKYLLQKETYLT